MKGHCVSASPERKSWKLACSWLSTWECCRRGPSCTSPIRSSGRLNFLKQNPVGGKEAALESPRCSPRLLEPEVLERRRVRKAWNQAHARLRDAWTDPGERAQLVQRRVHDAFVQDALDLMQQ